MESNKARINAANIFRSHILGLFIMNTVVIRIAFKNAILNDEELPRNLGNKIFSRAVCKLQKALLYVNEDRFSISDIRFNVFFPPVENATLGDR